MKKLIHFISDLRTQLNLSRATDVLFTITTFSTKTLGDIVNSAGIRIQVCLVIYPFLRLLLTFIFIVLLRFLFLQNVVHAETVPSSTVVETPESDSSVNVPKTNLFHFALGFGVVCVVLYVMVRFMNAEAPSAPEEFYLFSPDISVPARDYAIDLFNSTSAALTVLPLISETAIPLYTFCFSHMLNFFDNNPDHVLMIEKIKSLVLPVNSAFRKSAPTESNVFLQVIKCYAELFTQLNSDVERNICKVLSVNHRILTIYDPALNHSQIIKKLFAGDGMEKIFGLFDKSVTKVLVEDTLANVPSEVLDTPTYKAACQALYNSFAKGDKYLKDTASVLSLLKKSIPVFMWDLPGKAISPESPTLVLINSLDTLLLELVEKDPNHLYYLAKIKASIATYNALSASNLLDNQEIADNLMSAFMDHYGKEYLKD